MFDGESGLGTVRHAEKVEAYRISSPPMSVSAANRVKKYPVLAGPVSVPTALAATVTTALLSPESYGWEWVKGCMPEYGVCLSFYRQSDRIDVFLCFECRILMIVHNGVACGGEDFDPIARTLVRAAKMLFPVDGVIQALPEDSCTPPTNSANESGGSASALPPEK